jgi:ribosomal protein S11
MAYNRRKKKVKNTIVPEAEAHIHSTYNNTIVTICDNDGMQLVGHLLEELVIKVQKENSICCWYDC